MTDEWVIAVLGGAVAGLASALAATRAAIDTPSFASAALYLFVQPIPCGCPEPSSGLPPAGRSSS